MGEKPREAIAMLERALAIAPNRLDTRTSLVDAYRKLGLDEMAQLQEKKLEEIRKSIAEEKASQKDN